MTTLGHDEIRELLGAHALDAVNDDEAGTVRRHLIVCEDCAAEVAEHHEIAAMLANTGGDAPAHLWDRIEARLCATHPESHEGGGLEASGRHTHQRTRRAHPHQPRPSWWLAAAAVIVVVGLATTVVLLQGRVDQLRGDESPYQLVARAAQMALRAPGASDVRLVSSSDSRLAQIAILPNGTAFLVNDALPALPDTRTYQLWGRVGDRLVSLGLLGNDPRAIEFQVGTPESISQFAVTDEHAGGVVHSSHVPVAVSAA